VNFAIHAHFRRGFGGGRKDSFCLEGIFRVQDFFSFFRLDDSVSDICPRIPSELVGAWPREDDKLMAQLPGQPKVKLLAESETRFFLTDLPAEFEFVKDANRQCKQVVLEQAGFELTLRNLR
jgi:hypothetical protein